MAIISNLDIMLARRRMTLSELAERVGVPSIRWTGMWKVASMRTRKMI